MKNFNSLPGIAGIQTRFPRPCLECGKEHTHNNAFCSVSCCKQWRLENPNQGKPDLWLARYVNSLVPSISVPDFLRQDGNLDSFNKGIFK